MDDLQNKPNVLEIQAKPEWMSEEDWQLVEQLPARIRAGAIAMRKGLIEGTDQAAIIQAEAIHQEIAALVSPEQTHLATWCGYPTDLTRCSPFFPISPRDTQHREYLENYLITSAGWGQITYTGPLLTIFDEDVLMALIVLLVNPSLHNTTIKDGEKLTYTYTGPISALLKTMGYLRAGKEIYERVYLSLKRLMSSVLEMSISQGRTRAGKKKKPKYVKLSNILTNVEMNPETGFISITINPFFYEAYFSRTITLIDIKKRSLLKGSITKALYRFVQSQRNLVVFEGHFLTLADCLNMNRDQPTKITRLRLKESINELVKNNILNKKSKFISQDIVKIEKL